LNPGIEIPGVLSDHFLKLQYLVLHTFSFSRGRCLHLWSLFFLAISQQEQEKKGSAHYEQPFHLHHPTHSLPIVSDVNPDFIRLNFNLRVGKNALPEKHIAKKHLPAI